MTTPEQERYSWTTRIYAAAHDEDPGWADRSDGSYQAVDSLLGDMLAQHVATLSELLGLPPDEERSDADIADAINQLRAVAEAAREHVEWTENHKRLDALVAALGALPPDVR